LEPREYTIRQPPYAKGLPYRHVYSYVQTWNGSDYSNSIVVDEKDHPYTGTRFAWVRARLLGGKTNIWGRLALRLSDLDFKAASRDGHGEDWPIAYRDIEPYYDRVDRSLGISGLNERLPHLPDSLFQRPNRFTPAEMRGLKRVDAISIEMHGVPFLKSTPEQRTAVLERMSEKEPFFGEVKSRTIQAYYTSKIGIHDELGYLGNVYQRGDYAGFLPE